MVDWDSTREIWRKKKVDCLLYWIIFLFYIDVGAQGVMLSWKESPREMQWAWTMKALMVGLILQSLSETGLERRDCRRGPVPIQLQSTQTQDVKLGQLSFPKKGSVSCQTLFLSRNWILEDGRDSWIGGLRVCGVSNSVSPVEERSSLVLGATCPGFITSRDTLHIVAPSCELWEWLACYLLQFVCDPGRISEDASLKMISCQLLYVYLL